MTAGWGTMLGGHSRPVVDGNESACASRLSTRCVLRDDRDLTALARGSSPARACDDPRPNEFDWSGSRRRAIAEAALLAVIATGRVNGSGVKRAVGIHIRRWSDGRARLD